MRTDMECRSLGESKANFATTSSSPIRQMKQKDTTAAKSVASSGGAGMAVGLLAGAAVGALAGVLLAPDKGTVMRRKVADSATKLGDQVSKTYNAGREAATTWTSKLTKTGGKATEGSDESATDNDTSMSVSAGGNVKKSPYTDSGKNSDNEVKSMINDPKKPGASSGPSTTPKI